MELTAEECEGTFNRLREKHRQDVMELVSVIKSKIESIEEYEELRLHYLKSMHAFENPTFEELFQEGRDEMFLSYLFQHNKIAEQLYAVNKLDEKLEHDVSYVRTVCLHTHSGKKHRRSKRRSRK